MFLGRDRMSVVTITSVMKWHYLIVVGYCLTLLIGANTVLAADEAPKISDQKITEAVENALLVDASVSSDFIDVQVHQGIVTLTGVAPHYRSKERAGELIETVKGVRSIINGLTVRLVRRSDDEILRDVQRILQDDPVTEAYAITANVRDGVLKLSGTVPSWAAIELSEWVASGVHGVREIENALHVELKPKRSDTDILEEVQKRLKANVWINEASVLLSVNDSVVTLNGVVGSVAEKRRVVRDAHVVGVKDVDGSLLFVKAWAQGNMLRKREFGLRSDEEIKRNIGIGLFV